MFAVMKDDGTLTDTYKNSKTWTSAFTNLLEKPYSVGWTHDATFSSDATYHPSADVPMRDGALAPSLVRNHFLRAIHYDDLNDKGFKIGSYVPLAYYAIRIYPFVLSSEELAQNHFAELCDYHQIGDKAVNAYFALNAVMKKELHDSFVGVTYSDTNTEALQNAIFEMMGMMENGAGITMDVSYSTPSPSAYSLPGYWRFSFFGEKGWLECRFRGGEVLTAKEGDEKARVIPAPPVTGNYLDDFICDVNGGKPAFDTQSVLDSARATLMLQADADRMCKGGQLL
jgi:hypothetical protein